jgi:ubiquitin C-terminal hydrolase
LDPYSKAGLLGVKNYGNTCFISAAVHLLANCHDLVKYFLSKMYLEEINKSGKKSGKGQISKVFYDLIKDYWLGAQEVIEPYDLKQIVANITSQVIFFNF